MSMKPMLASMPVLLIGLGVLVLRCPAPGQAVEEDMLAGASSAGCPPSWLTSIGQPGPNAYVHALAVFDDGTGRSLYVAGDFSDVEGVAAKRIATWDGWNWSELIGGMNNSVLALAAFDDGTGTALYAGGHFTVAGGTFAKRIARWNGSTWAALGAGIGESTGLDDVKALATFDDGSGLALYAGGNFTLAGGVAADRIARWDGTHWTALGSGLDDDPNALAVFDDGTGPALYAAGEFTVAGGVPAKYIAKWDGSSWSALGDGLIIWAWALAVHDDGSGPALFAGTASFLGGSPLVKWDGSSWSDVGTANGAVYALTEYDDGSGLVLLAGGDFTKVAGVDAKRVAKWDGSAWSALGSGVNDRVLALAAYDDGDGTALHVAGEFTTAGGAEANYLAAWGCPPEPSPWANLGFALAGSAGKPILVGTGDLTVGTPGTLTLEQAKASTSSHLVSSIGSAPIPFKGGTLVPVPVLWDVWLGTSSAGSASVAWPSFPPGLSGLDLYFQCVIPDSAATLGVALSNALHADVP